MLPLIHASVLPAQVLSHGGLQPEFDREVLSDVDRATDAADDQRNFDAIDVATAGPEEPQRIPVGSGLSSEGRQAQRREETATISFNGMSRPTFANRQFL